MPNDFSVVTLSTWTGLTEVRLYDETIDHIFEHGEFRLYSPSDAKRGLLRGIANPNAIYDSTTNPGRAVVLVSMAFTYLGNPLHVPVKLVDGTSGRVATAYFSDGTYSGALLWGDNDD